MEDIMFKKALVMMSIVAAVLTAVAVGARYVQTGKTAAASLSEANRLALGALRLEDTAQAVTAEQADDLATLWKAYLSLSDDDTTAPTELEALARQIGQGMTAEQLAAIDAMALTASDVTAFVQQQGAQNPSNASFSQASQAAAQGGQSEQGGMMGGGEMMGEPPLEMAEAGAWRGNATPQGGVGGGEQAPTVLYEAVIALFEAKV